MGRRKDEKPKGMALPIFWRLFRQYALKYWVRLSIALLSVLIMGGSIHILYQFMDFGVSSLLSGFNTEETGDSQQNRIKNDIFTRISENRVIRKTLEIMHIDMKSSAEEVLPSEEGQKSPAEKPKGDDAIFKRINAISEKFGMKVSSDQALSFPLVCLLVVVLLGFFLLQTLGIFFNKYLLRWIGARIVTDLRIQLFDVFQRQSMAFFHKHDVGELISRCTNDTNVIETSFANSIAEAFVAPVQMLVAALFVYQKAMTAGLMKPVLILAVAMPVVIVPVYIISRLMRYYQQRVLQRVSSLLGRMQENLSGIQVVKSFNTEDFESRRFSDSNETYFCSVKRAILADLFMQPSMQMSALLLAGGFLILCLHYKISLGALIVIGYAAQNAYKPIKELAKLNSNMQKCAAAAERVFASLDLKEVIPESEKPQHLESFKDSICFENVTFSYSADRKILKNFTLEIKKGQMVALVGATGSGKSTLANLLPRFYDPDEGRITIDGIDIRDVPNADLKGLIGIVAQDTFLFNESVAFNIGYGRIGASLEQIQEAARQANAHDFIMEDPLGYERPCGERGALLSGGQKQRLAIARAILKNPPIMILDEATSALDTETEKQVQTALTQLMKDRTVLCIAHRLSTIVNADIIVVVDNGEIVEQGTHQELLELNGKYRRLYELQAPAGN